ncbi:MAG TPA: inositol monophosphatase family protein [Burkholderiaceae bacterium]|nr:inositol monophosphatase family protein [Burkholderiaceae bacterium]
MSTTYHSAPAIPDECREFVPFFRVLIRRASDVIRPLFMSGTAVITKSDATPVTLADRGAEEAMRREIERTYPAHGILGEEYGEKPARGTEDTRYRWVLDPVDGTKAFISNCFLFGTLIALERDDGEGFRPIFGAIAHPAAGVALIGRQGETRLYSADGSERVVRVRPCRRLEDATVLASSHWESQEQRIEGATAEALAAVMRRAKLYRTWGDCFGYFALATGGADVMLDPVLAYWDVAALVPVIEGAGGRLTSWTGGDPLAQPSAIATAGPLHAELLTLLNT